LAQDSGQTDPTVLPNPGKAGGEAGSSEGA